MIDTIRIVKDVNLLPKGFEKHLFSIMEDQKLTLKDLKLENPTEQYLGKVGGMTISFNKNKLTLLGSLTTWATGSNLKFADKDQLIQAIFELENVLEFSLKDAKVTRLDVAGNIVTRSPVLEYCKCLLDINKFKRYEQPSGVIFQNDTTYIQFYDKLEEMRDKRYRIDQAFTNHYILRYECRFRADSFKRLINIRRPSLVEVFDRYNVFLEEWRNLFESITKKRDMLEFSSEIFNQKLEFDRALEVLGINSIGGLAALLSIISNAKANNYFSGHKDQATVLKKRMKNLMSRPLLTKKSDLVLELESKINLVFGCSIDDDQTIWE